MTRRNTSGWSFFQWVAISAFAVAAVWGICGHALAVGLNYVDGDDFTNLFPNDASAIDSGSSIGNDNKWGFRAFGAPHNGSAQIFEAGAGANPASTTENAPEINQKVTGLTPNTSYDFYAVFWSSDGQNWTQRAGVAPGVNTLYDRIGPTPGVLASAVAAKPAAGAVWDTPPEIPLTAGSPRYHEGDRSMLLGFAGTAMSNASGEASVYLDDLPTSAGGSGTTRSFFDGVAYVASGTTVSLTASVDRGTGEVMVTNPTATPFQIKAITLGSVSGALNATEWNKITGNTDGHGTGSFDSDNWSVTAPVPPALPMFTTVLAESEDSTGLSSGGTLAAGGTLNFGDIWQRNPVEDVTIQLVLAEGSPANLIPTFSGTPVAPADLDGSGSPELPDFQTLLNNLHANITALTAAEGHTRGDINNDRLINFQDFQAFRMAFDVAHGEGAFEVLLAQVPEPASLGVAVVAAAIVGGWARRRRVVQVALALLVCCVTANQTLAVNLLSVDIDDRSEGEAGMPGNTVAGFSSYLLTATGTPPPSMSTISTQAIGAYTVSFIAFDDHLDENPSTPALNDAVGAIDDRDRAVPVDGGALTYGQLYYDDLLFAGVSTGPTGGMDLTVSGGTLQPNTVYSVSIYAFDNGSTPAPQPRTAVWRDGNNNNLNVLSTSFQGALLPTYNEQYKYNGVARTDATGQLFLKGRSTTPQSATATNIGVFINAFEINTFAELTLVVDAGSGAMRIQNDQAGSLDLSYYEIRSVAGSLNTAGWTSFEDGELGDPVGTGWDESPNSNANLLNEVNLQAVTSIAPGGNKSLGAGFTGGGTQDLIFLYSTPTDLTLRAGLVKYLAGGDFNADGDVNSTDFNDPTLGFKARFGTNLTGFDFLAWQRNFGFDGPPPSAAAGSAVPEPGTIALATLAMGALAPSRRGLRRRTCSRPPSGGL